MNSNMCKYVIIGGQYEPQNYGIANNLKEAKEIADQNEEYWDNWQGWRKPLIYRLEDTRVITCKNWITHVDGTEIRIPKVGASPMI